MFFRSFVFSQKLFFHVRFLKFARCPSMVGTASRYSLIPVWASTRLPPQRLTWWVPTPPG